MSTWKKVALTEDIGVFAGGSNSGTLGGNQHDVVLVGASGNISHFNPGTSKLIVGNGSGQLDNFSIAADGDVTAVFDSTADDITLSIASNAVDTLEIKADAITLAKIDHAGFDSASMDGALLFWNGSSVPTVLEKGAAGKVLKISSSNIPAWEDAGSATNVNVNNGGDATDANFGIFFGSETGLGGKDADKAYIDGTTDSYKLSYNPHLSSVTHVSPTTGVYADTAGNNNAAGLYSEYGFAGDLAGTATVAKGIETSAVTTGTYYAPMVIQNTAAAHGQEVYTNSAISYSVNGAGDVDVTIAGNLILSGSATELEINAETVNIADFRMRLAHTDSTDSAADGGAADLTGDQIQTAAGAMGVGIVVDNASVGTEANLARFAYRGNKANSNYTASKSVLGWVMAQEQNSAASAAATEIGVGAMYVSAEAAEYMSTAGSDDNLNFGVGAMAYLGADNGLWIQTA